MGQSSRQPVPSGPSYLVLLQADAFTRFIEKLERGDSPESAAEANGVFQFFLLRGNIGMAYAWRNQYLPSGQPLDADTLKVAISAGGEAFDFIVELYPGLLISSLVQQSEGLREQLMELLDMHSDLFFRAKALIYIAGDALQQELGPLLDVALRCRDEILLSQLQSLAPRCVPQSLYELLSHDASYEFSYLEAAETQYWDLFFWKLSVGDVVTKDLVSYFSIHRILKDSDEVLLLARWKQLCPVAEATLDDLLQASKVDLACFKWCCKKLKPETSGQFVVKHFARILQSALAAKRYDVANYIRRSWMPFVQRQSVRDAIDSRQVLTNLKARAVNHNSQLHSITAPRFFNVSLPTESKEEAQARETQRRDADTPT